MTHLIDLNEISLSDFNLIYHLTIQIMNNPKNFNKSCSGKILASLFFEPSTRTNMSFNAAMIRLGGNIIGFNDPSVSSTAKGESLKDTIIMMSTYSDVIVLRSKYEGAAKAASLYSSVPVINAGDGGHLHPTQTLVDAITMLILRGHIDNMIIGICGDLKYGRTVHSLIKFLSRYKNIKIYLISSESLKLPIYIKDYINQYKKNISFIETKSLDDVIHKLDILYMTRIQRERFDNEEKNYDDYCLTSDKLLNAKKDLIIMHPLPRVDEISDDIDNDERAAYFQQAKIGMYVRMALLMKLINTKKELEIKYTDINNKNNIKCTNLKCITYQEKLYQNNIINNCIFCDNKLIF